MFFSGNVKAPKMWKNTENSLISHVDPNLYVCFVVCEDFFTVADKPSKQNVYT